MQQSSSNFRPQSEKKKWLLRQLLLLLCVLQKMDKNMLSHNALVLTCERSEDVTAMRLTQMKERLRLVQAPSHGRIEMYLPHPGHDQVLFFDDGPPPASLIEISADTIDSLHQWSERDEARRLFDVLNVGQEWSAGYFSIVRQVVAGEALPRERVAELSFVVRYYPPVEDARLFAAHYVANHPPILARLPRVRNVLCYLPLDETVPGFKRDEIVIRNEVVFDSLIDLIDSQKSSLRAELSADCKAFPPFGYSLHHAMLRELLSSDLS